MAYDKKKIKEPDPVFTIDLGKIVAKLHLAGRETHGDPNKCVFFNAGVINDDYKYKLNASNENLPQFDLKNSSGKYELGVIVTQPDVINYDNKYSLDDITNQLSTNDLKSDSAKQTVDAAILANVESRHTKINGDLKSFAKQLLTDYMLEFAGKSNADSIKDADLTMFELDDKDYAKASPDMFKYSNCEITSASEKNIKAMHSKDYAASIKDPKNKKMSVKCVGFKIGYIIDKEY